MVSWDVSCSPLPLGEGHGEGLAREQKKKYFLLYPQTLSQREREFLRNAFLLDKNHLWFPKRAFKSFFRHLHIRWSVRNCYRPLVSRLIVVSRVFQLCFGTIKHDAKHSFARQPLEQTIDDRISSC